MDRDNAPRKRSPSNPRERWRERNPVADWAHAATRAAIRRGLIVPPNACSCCGETGRIEAHHPDHRDPLKVTWLLARCHRRLHAAERRAKHGPR